jgi:hypothetical protein
MLRNGTSDYVDLPAGLTMHGGDPETIVTGGPQTFTYQGVDSAGKVFSVTGTSRWDAGTCTFTAHGSIEP